MPLKGDPMALHDVLVAGAKVERDSSDIKRHLQHAYQDKLTGARSGRMYTTEFFTDKTGKVRPIGSRAPHLASAPGEAPAFDTGKLLRGMNYTDKHLSDGAEVTIKATTFYAGYLEFGTSQMQPRPFFRVTLKEQSNNLRKIWKDGIEGRERGKARELGGTG